MPAKVHTGPSAMKNRSSSGPLQAIGGARRLLLASAGDEYETQMERDARAIIAAAKGAEAQEGMAAFLLKRGPNFSKSPI